MAKVKKDLNKDDSYEKEIVSSAEITKQNIKYFKLAEDAKIEDFKLASEKVHNGEYKWLYYAIDGNKGYHYYIINKKK